ncbi:MAG TPA: VOC family protein [Myxococcota bacterium]|nr:VOC family protein [Myxococcota bacterium]
MLDHLGLTVADLARSQRDGGRPTFWLGVGAAPKTGTDVAFAAPERATVARFHAAAIAAGGRDHGAPGLRPHYHPDYYGAFVLDPDGHAIEAVCHRPER